MRERKRSSSWAKCFFTDALLFTKRSLLLTRLDIHAKSNFRNIDDVRLEVIFAENDFAISMKNSRPLRTVVTFRTNIGPLVFLGMMWENQWHLRWGCLNDTRNTKCQRQLEWITRNVMKRIPKIRRKVFFQNTNGCILCRRRFFPSSVDWSVRVVMHSNPNVSYDNNCAEKLSLNEEQQLAFACSHRTQDAADLLLLLLSTIVASEDRADSMVDQDKG